MTTHSTTQSNSLIKTGGALGIAASFIALAILLVAIFGFRAVFMLSILPLVLGGVGMVISIVGAIKHQPTGNDETQPVAAMFVCLAAIVGGMIEWMLM